MSSAHVRTGGGRAPGQVSGARRPSWPVQLLTLAAVTSSSLSALSLYHLLSLRAEVEGLRSEVLRRREEQQETRHGEAPQQISSSRVRRSGSDPVIPLRPENTVSQPCLQLKADSNREPFQKEFASENHTGIPWQVGLKRGTALDAESDSILVREEGYYFVYSQVYYMDKTFAMGHVVIRRKRNVVGDEAQHVTLFRCIQNMDPVYHYNTCYTGGIVKLEVGDAVELLIPRSRAKVSLDGDSTFLGAVRLA
ncbi:tumor necrosis factor ligand superfamily member 13B isoform X2 [Esox lucius]|uniref:tumor necrosis factor ligand superfamily member 13B isoform X2 n=1 Tax=Esox lucius TaxID=8010 RepID=UPI0005763917|nr:tumor necrosis factor ligand superfamily member 13B isoform X2 [Esox lucius]